MRMLERLAESAPFLLALSAPPVKFSTQRIVEAFIIAMMTALASGYVTVKILDERTEALAKRMDRVEQAADARYGSIQEDLRRIYTILVENRQIGKAGR